MILAVIMLMSLGVAAYAETLTLPANLKTIEEEAFAGDSSLGEVVVPEGATAIGNRAFADSGLKRIDIPGTVTEIADDAFDGTSDLTIHAMAGTYAVDYARAHRITLDSNIEPGLTASHSVEGDYRLQAWNPTTEYYWYWVSIGEPFTMIIDAWAEIGKLHYEWSVDGVLDQEATGCKYTLNADHYHAVEGRVSDDYGNSKVFSFEVSPDTHLTAYTVNYEGRYLVAAGQSKVLTVMTSCDTPMTYQWYRIEQRGEDVERIKIDGATQTKYKTGPINGYTEYEFDAVDSYGNTATVGIVVSIDTHLRVGRVNDNEYMIYVTPGEPATMQATATCDVPVSYQWYRIESWGDGPGYDRVPIPGATEASYTTGPVVSPAEYQCEVTDAYGISDAVFFDVAANTNLTASAVNGSQSNTIAVAPGETAELRVEASCDVPITYQWYEWIDRYDKNGIWIGGTKIDFDGATDAAFTTSPITSPQIIYCVVSDTYGNTNYIRFELKVETHFNAHAKGYNNSISVYPGETAELEVEASCDAPLSYQWYKDQSIDASSYSANSVLIEGATQSRYSIPPADATQRFTCLVSDSYGNSSKISFYVTVNSNLNAHAKDYQNYVSVPFGEPAVLEAVVTCDAPVSYQWMEEIREYSETGSYYSSYYEPIEGATDASYTIPAVDGPSYYNCLVSDPYGNTLRLWFNVSVETHLEAHALNNKTSFAVSPNEISVLTVEATCDEPLSYQWYVNYPTYDAYGVERYTETKIIEGATGPSYTTPPATDGRDYMCRVSDPYGNEKSVSFNMSIPTNLTVSAKDMSTYFTVEKGETVQLSVEVSCDAPVTVQWFAVNPSTWSREVIDGETGNSYTTEPVLKDAKYTCQVVDAYHNYKTITFELNVEKQAQ